MTAAGEGLEPDLLHCIVFGPGYGESIAVRIPPDHWLVVDSLRTGDRVPAAQAIKSAGGQVECLVLTHPHLDHAAGFEELVAGASATAAVGCVAPVLETRELWRDPDAEEQLRKGATEHALCAIEDRWRTRPASRWELRTGAVRALADATVTALYPDDDALSETGEVELRRDPNRLASPVMVEWGSVRLVLGADLPRRGWKAIGRHPLASRVRIHQVYKVAHHGSKGAHEPAVVGPPSGTTCTWVVTPWDQGRGLPQFGDDEGMARLLESVPEVVLTAAPFRHEPGAPPPLRTTRTAMAERGLRGTARRKFTEGVVLEEIDPPSAGDGWVRLSFDRRGALLRTEFGPRSVVVREDVRVAPKELRTRGARGRKR